ncbi:MAG: hypothetical protein M3O22_05695, partial [Pseudomonadota bacterium]|nr:hypothetical protein [Pseudomonadota bacterium]
AEYVRCSVCGVVTAQPRFIVFWSVVSFLLVSRRKGIQGVFCRACADRQALRSSFSTWIFGWWAIPRGPFIALDALLRNLMGGDQPVFDNVDVLIRQARAFAAHGRRGLARTLAETALRMARDRRQVAEVMGVQAGLGPGKPVRIQDRWRLSGGMAFHLQFLPLMGLLLACLYGLSIPVSMLWKGLGDRSAVQAVAVPRPGEVWHVTADNTEIRSGPTLFHPEVARVARYTTAVILPGHPDDVLQKVGITPWGPVYIERAWLAPGEGTGAWRAACRESPAQLPAVPAILQRSSFGMGNLRIENRLPRDILLKVRDGQGDTVLTLYLQKGVSTTVSGMPPGDFSVLYATGQGFSSRCAIFMDAMETFRALDQVSIPNVFPGQEGVPAIFLSVTPERAEPVPGNRFIHDGQ